MPGRICKPTAKGAEWAAHIAATKDTNPGTRTTSCPKPVDMDRGPSFSPITDNGSPSPPTYHTKPPRAFQPTTEARLLARETARLRREATLAAKQEALTRRRLTQHHLRMGAVAWINPDKTAKGMIGCWTAIHRYVNKGQEMEMTREQSQEEREKWLRVLGVDLGEFDEETRREETKKGKGITKEAVAPEDKENVEPLEGASEEDVLVKIEELERELDSWM